MGVPVKIGNITAIGPSFVPNNAYKACNIWVYLNGDSSMPAKRVPINPLAETSLDRVYTKITNSLEPSAKFFVRGLYSIQGKRIKKVSHLKDGYRYVAARGSSTHFQDVPYESIDDNINRLRASYIENLSNLRKESPPERPYSPPRSPVTANAKYDDYEQPKVIFIFKNGDVISPATKFIFYKRDTEHWSKFLQNVSSKIKLSRGPVIRLYHLQPGTYGREVWKGGQLQDGGNYVACSYDDFKFDYPYRIGYYQYRPKARERQAMAKHTSLESESEDKEPGESKMLLAFESRKQASSISVTLSGKQPLGLTTFSLSTNAQQKDDYGQLSNDSKFNGSSQQNNRIPAALDMAHPTSKEQLYTKKERSNLKMSCQGKPLTKSRSSNQSVPTYKKANNKPKRSSGGKRRSPARSGRTKKKASSPKVADIAHSLISAKNVSSEAINLSTATLSDIQSTNSSEAMEHDRPFIESKIMPNHVTLTDSETSLKEHEMHTNRPLSRQTGRFSETQSNTSPLNDDQSCHSNPAAGHQLDLSGEGRKSINHWVFEQHPSVDVSSAPRATTIKLAPDHPNKYARISRKRTLRRDTMNTTMHTPNSNSLKSKHSITRKSTTPVNAQPLQRKSTRASMNPRSTSIIKNTESRSSICLPATTKNETPKTRDSNVSNRSDQSMTHSSTSIKHETPQTEPSRVSNEHKKSFTQSSTPTSRVRPKPQPSSVSEQSLQQSPTSTKNERSDSKTRDSSVSNRSDQSMTHSSASIKHETPQTEPSRVSNEHNKSFTQSSTPTSRVRPKHQPSSVSEQRLQQSPPSTKNQRSHSRDSRVSQQSLARSSHSGHRKQTNRSTTLIPRNSTNNAIKVIITKPSAIEIKQQRDSLEIPAKHRTGHVQQESITDIEEVSSNETAEYAIEHYDTNDTSQHSDARQASTPMDGEQTNGLNQQSIILENDKVAAQPQRIDTSKMDHNVIPVKRFNASKSGKRQIPKTNEKNKAPHGGRRPRVSLKNKNANNGILKLKPSTNRNNSSPKHNSGNQIQVAITRDKRLNQNARPTVGMRKSRVSNKSNSNNKVPQKTATKNSKTVKQNKKNHPGKQASKITGRSRKRQSSTRSKSQSYKRYH